MKNNYVNPFPILILILFLSFGVFSQTTEFTYQGKLTVSGAAASGNFDFEFVLFDALSGGTQIGSTNTRSSVAVSAGVFTVNLDFGPEFPGAARFIEIHVRQTGVGAFTPLAPRQAISNAPYAVKSLNADTATNATTATTATNAVNAATADNATNAQFALQSTNSTNAQNAVTAQNAINLGGITSNQYLKVNGDGSQLTNVKGTFKWNVITTDQQAEPNKGYLVNSPVEVTVNLPTAPQVGDVIRIADAGEGGWRISQNAGQSITRIRSDAEPNTQWIPRESNRAWVSVASSADGAKLVAVVEGGQIYTSIDAGETWTPHEGNRFWRSVASSGDGTKLVAVVVGGQIYTSADSGVTWIPTESNRNWLSVASSADGTKLVAVFNGGQIYISADSGVTWTLRDSNRNWESVASSADGTKLVAVTGFGQIYTSTDSGVTWTPRDSNRNWTSVASSADGTKLIAGSLSQIYISTNSGVTWSARAFFQNWKSVASSADGTKLVAVVNGGQIYTSADSFLTWTVRESNRQWWSVASSADGTRLFATVLGGQIYTKPIFFSTSTGPLGALKGGSGSSVELIYLGGGQFFLTDSKGSTIYF